MTGRSNIMQANFKATLGWIRKQISRRIFRFSNKKLIINSLKAIVKSFSENLIQYNLSIKMQCGLN